MVGGFSSSSHDLEAECPSHSLPFTVKLSPLNIAEIKEGIIIIARKILMMHAVHKL